MAYEFAFHVDKCDISFYTVKKQKIDKQTDKEHIYRKFSKVIHKIKLIKKQTNVPDLNSLSRPKDFNLQVF